MGFLGQTKIYDLYFLLYISFDTKRGHHDRFLHQR